MLARTRHDWEGNELLEFLLPSTAQCSMQTWKVEPLTCQIRAN